jgi:protein subunit release factor A
VEIRQYCPMETQDQAPWPFPVPHTDEDLLAQCRIETFTAGGKGGQHQNRTESGVRLTHLPTGVVVTAREDRSQFRNKAVALSRLRSRLHALNRRPAPRISTRVPRRERERRLEEKKRRSRVKKLRRKPPVEGGE